jgi:2-polyprenyl-6-methoxyphenol hydroxylase-like FAD-dependent oxidoreductase
MANAAHFDVIIVGGGIAGSTLGGVLARGGLGVVVVEKEAQFRDRVRGEFTWPYGVADALAIGLGAVFDQVGCIPMTAIQLYDNQQPSRSRQFASEVVPGIGFSHPRLQDALIAWAAAQGANLLRPAKATAFTRNGGPTVTVGLEHGEREYRARLVVGADGKLSKTRQWTGGGTAADPEHHRFGGVFASGVQTNDKGLDNVAWVTSEEVNWFAAGPERTRIYLVMAKERVRETGVDRTFAAIVDYAAPVMPEGALDLAKQEGPIGFFPNNDIWATKVTGNAVALIGDAAGAPDPSRGHGTALLFHDVRLLSELLLSERDWGKAIADFGSQRSRYYEVILESDRWNCLIDAGRGEEAYRLREGHARAREHDPSLRGFGVIESYGPDGLVADEAARRHYFGQDL